MSDFSRDTFNPELRFSRVLMQQGRVQLDADWNEQVAISTHALREMARDLIGPWGGPEHELGFEIKQPDNGGEFTIGEGVYYVNGIRCRNGSLLNYTQQPHPAERARAAHGASSQLLTPGRAYLVYLDVWERHMTYVEQPSIREVALLGPDTAARAQIVWQVNHADVTERLLKDEKDERTLKAERAWEILQAELGNPGTLPRMVASLKEEPAAVEACIASPEARYRGLENQLYRVEIHNGGVMSSGKSTEGNPEEPDRSPAEPDKAGAGGPTFKWSRENGSVVFPVESGLDTDGDFLTATLRHLGRDPRSGLVEGDWVEWVDEDIVLTHAARPLLRVVRVEPSTRRVTLTRPDGGDIARTDEKKRPFLRRWDQKSKRGQALREGAVPIAEGQLIPLEDGIMVQFKSNGARYRTGDYWLIPARTATGGIEWPRNRELPPSGVEHGYAPLAAIFFDPQKSKVIDFRRHFKAAGIPVAP